jgi:hypothetical protein
MAHPDWKLYQSPVLVVKPMMSAAFAFTFPPTEVCPVNITCLKVQPVVFALLI